MRHQWHANLRTLEANLSKMSGAQERLELSGQILRKLLGEEMAGRKRLALGL